MRSEGYCSRFVCPSVRPLIGNSLLERLLVLKTLSRTQWATKVKKFVGICLKPLRSRVMPRNKSEEANMLIIPGQLSPLDTQRSVRGVPNDCQQRSALPKTMPTDAASLCWRAPATQLHTRGVANFRARALA